MSVISVIASGALSALSATSAVVIPGPRKIRDYHRGGAEDAQFKT